MRRASVIAVTSLFMLISAPAWACGGLIGPNGAVNLVRTTTLAAYHDGIEHYVTAFTFAGIAEGSFGSIVPLPAEPSKVERGGDWTLQRLIQETEPPERRFAALGVTAEASREARVLQQTRIDALDITILEGGGDEVGLWAKRRGFRLPPDAPEVLDFYASRSPIFMAAQFDADAAAARGQQAGDGTPIHLTIPTDNPWVPLRILALGKQASEIVEADVYLLTDREPSILPAVDALTIERSERASSALMRDLRSDKGMGWMPEYSMWLTHIELSSRADALEYDLAVDTDGGRPSAADTGLRVVPPGAAGSAGTTGLAAAIVGAVLILWLLVALAAWRVSARPV